MDDTREIATDADEATARPAAPLPPPSTWGAHRSGPGSPVGSVRPPDTTGTSEPEGDISGRSRPSVVMVMLAALVGAVLGTAGTLTLARTTLGGPGGDVRAPVVEAPEGGEANAVAAVAEAVTPSVVRVDRLRSGQGGQAESGLGSGVIYRSDGYIITNNHVVEGADALRVTFASGETARARVVGTDPLTDIAVLRVDREDLPALNVRSGPVTVGELAVAIGAPFGLNASVTAGIVSGTNRSLEVPIEGGLISIPNVIQTDAAINPGNSGGALVDESGRLIGINTAILSTAQGLGQAAGNIGIGFAISADDAVDIADTLIEDGVVRHARLGIIGGTTNVAAGQEEGVLIEDVMRGGPAHEAGIEPGDIIVEADGQRITAMDELTALIREREPGDVLPLVVLRDGERLEIEATLGEWN